MALQPNGERPPNQQYAVIPRTPWRYRNRDICRRYRDGWPNAKITSVACAASRVRTPYAPSRRYYRHYGKSDISRINCQYGDLRQEVPILSRVLVSLANPANVAANYVFSIFN
jgi:hypothetical protein